MKNLFFFLLLLVFSLSVSAQDKTITYYTDPASDPPELIIDLKHISADISFKPDENLVRVAAELTFIAKKHKPDSIIFYAPDFSVSMVRITKDGKSVCQDPIQWKYSGNSLIIYTSSACLDRSKEYQLILNYEARPKSGAIYFVGWRHEEKGKRQAIWAHRPHGWLPYIDARLTMDMRYTFGKDFNVFANGDRADVKENPDGTKTWHYVLKKNHPFFSTCVVIGDYQFSKSSSQSGVPLEYWYYTGEEKKVKPTYQFTEQMMDFIEKELGFPYPYSVYRQAPVIDYMYGGMETTTATVFGDFMLIDPHAFWQRNYINTNAHELAHQWFGNCITQLANKDVWLTESFGTYYAKVFERSFFGEDYYQNSMNEEYKLVMEAAKSNNFPVRSSRSGNARIYQKGSLVLGMLRDIMGDEEFRQAVSLYLKRWNFNYAEAGNFFRCVYDVTGTSYNWFFEEWINRGGEPHYKVSYEIADDTTGSRFTRVSVKQIQETDNLTGLFKMPVTIEVHYKNGAVGSTVEWIEKQSHVVTIPNPEKQPVAYVLFDPGRKVLKKVTFERTPEELAAQAQSAGNMIDSYDALLAMKNIPTEKKRKVLLECFAREQFHLTRSEIIQQLAADRSDPVISVFRLSLSDPDANVRKTAISQIFPVPEVLRPDFEKRLNDSSYLNIELALQSLCLSFPERAGEYLERTKSMEGWRGLNIRMKWLEIAIGNGKPEYTEELIRYTGPVYEFETRINSLMTLKKLRFLNAVTYENALSASKHWNHKLRDAGKEYLTYFGY